MVSGYSFFVALHIISGWCASQPNRLHSKPLWTILPKFVGCYANGHTILLRGSYWFHWTLDWWQWLSRSTLSDGGVSEPHRQHWMARNCHTAQLGVDSFFPIFLQLQTFFRAHACCSPCPSLYPLDTKFWYQFHIVFYGSGSHVYSFSGLFWRQGLYGC